MKNDDIVIVAAKRTPIGNFTGQFAQTPAPDLAATAIQAAVTQSMLASHHIDACIMGCVLPAGLGQAPARQAALKAGLCLHCESTTVNKMCGSGMKAIMLATDLLRTGDPAVIVAGGMENMTRAPYLLQKARTGYRLGHDKLYDHLFFDGLEDAYEPGKLMGVFAEATAKTYGFSRQDQDAFALESIKRAQHAVASGAFESEIAPVDVQIKKQILSIKTDEGPSTAKPEKVPQLQPAFDPQGTITAANASSISDGAAAMILMRYETAKQHELLPLARVVGHATHADKPALFPTAPIGAIEKLCQRINWSITEVDLFEINEAFAVVTMAAMQSLNLDFSKVNVHGGACVLGHPIGASGARILVTLLYALKQQQKQRGIAALCIGGGEATAVALELI